MVNPTVTERVMLNCQNFRQVILNMRLPRFSCAKNRLFSLTLREKKEVTIVGNIE